MRHRLSSFGLLLALVAAPALAQVSVADAWVRGTVPGQKATGAFMQITSPTDSALVAAASPAAKIVEIHEMKMDGGVMRMKAVDRVPLAAGKPVALAPGGYHVMLMDLKLPLQKDTTIPLTLRFKNAKGVESKTELKVPVSQMAPGAMAEHKHP